MGIYLFFIGCLWVLQLSYAEELKKKEVGDNALYLKHTDAWRTWKV